MSLTTAISADIRARAGYIPFCCLCSFPQVNILVRPGIRVVTFPATRDFPEGRTIFKLDGCCLFSTPQENYFATEAEATQFWRAHRLQPLWDISTDNRRRNCIAKLREANLEPIE